MSKVRDLPEITTLDDNDLLYSVDASAGPNGGRKITKSNLKETIKQSSAEIKTSYESNSDTNAFTDAEKAKLATIESGAQFQDADEVPYSGTTSGLSAINVQDAIDQVSSVTQADFRPSILSGRVLHYTGGSARFDDVNFTILPGDILLEPNITLGEVYVDLDGLVKQTASGINAPPLSIVFAKFSTNLNNIVSLIDERVKNSQNLVRGILSDIRDVRAGSASQAGSSGRLSDAAHKHEILTAAAITQSPDQTNAEGVAAELARADHIHEIPTDVPVTLIPDQANAVGVSTSFARADHMHEIAADTAVDLNPASTSTEGISNSFARADHTHAIATSIVSDISTIQPDAAASAGIVDSFARGDHTHAINTDTAVGLSPASTSTEGASTSFARANHTHQIATATVGDITTIQPNAAAAAGVADNFARGDHTHAISAAAAVGLDASSTSTEGASTSFARADHTHAISAGIISDIATIQPDAAASAGTSVNFARADHRHAIDAAAAVTIDASSSNTEGAATSFARSNHTHQISTGVVSAQAPDQANAAGSSANLARADHVHSIPTATAVGLDATSTSAQGAAATFARSNHTHAIATGAASSISTSSTNTTGSSANLARADHTHAVSLTHQEVSSTVDTTTTSATDVLMDGMIITPPSGTYAVTWSGSIVNSANGAERTWISIYIGGSQDASSERVIGTGGGAYSPSMTHDLVTVNGSQAIEVRWRVAAGTSTVRSRKLIIIRLSN